MPDRLLAYRVWCVLKDGGEMIASLPYTDKHRAEAIRGLAISLVRRKESVESFELRTETIPGTITVNGQKFVSKIVVVGDDRRVTRL